MKKKILIPIIIFLIIVITITCIILLNNKKYSTLLLDINPSIEITFDDNEVIDIKAINDDAKDIINDDFKGQELDIVLEEICGKLIEEGYTDDGGVTVLLYVEGASSNDLENKIKNSFVKRNINPEVIVIDNITEEDKKIAEEYNISASKASYINSLKKDTDTFTYEELIDKSSKELKQMKETGLYCDEGYFLEEDLCFKEVERVSAKEGKVCPRNYYDYNGKCYEEVGTIEGDKETCSDGFEMFDGKCINTIYIDPIGICENGEYDGGHDICREEVYIGDAYEYCRDPGRTLYDHKCLATKPTINGGCLNGDMLYNGKCVNTRNDYYASEWMCPNGKTNSGSNGELLFEDNRCMETKETAPLSLECEEGFTLNGKKCIKTETREPEKERICPANYTMVNEQRCINLTNTKDYEDGFVCEGPNTRNKGKECVIYDTILPKKYLKEN